MPLTRAGLIARTTLPAALSTLTDAASWLERHGCTPVIERASATAAGVDGRWPTSDRGELGKDVEVVLVFGGDGTLLDAASAVAHAGYDAPLFGVNLGRLGFLTEIGRGDLTTALEALHAGRTQIETRLMLEGRVVRGGTRIAERLALNDIVVTRGALSRMIEIDAAVDGQQVCRVKADGLIIATATGSTAYNLSAGGPIVHPSVDAMVMTPIAPHTLTNRPLVLPATATVTLRPEIEPRSDIVVTFDGQFGQRLEPDDAIEIVRASRVLTLMHLAGRSHYDMLREKLQWGR
ncbi:MAG TPA: NAD(+)/NADH kinase [Vicinamibacterales bacterium]|nr:NAD(+)/NADH kinase [Vicinamibacterales bacterium]